ncbi:hypothetical protein Pelo_10650 [Pelomyxa schiedti]|nr:hypothetical protein Pelo_10650 [Pelomyxa schiedti]
MKKKNKSKREFNDEFYIEYRAGNLSDDDDFSDVRSCSATATATSTTSSTGASRSKRPLSFVPGKYEAKSTKSDSAAKPPACSKDSLLQLSRKVMIENIKLIGPYRPEVAYLLNLHEKLLDLTEDVENLLHEAHSQYQEAELKKKEVSEMTKQMNEYEEGLKKTYTMIQQKKDEEDMEQKKILGEDLTPESGDAALKGAGERIETIMKNLSLGVKPEPQTNILPVLKPVEGLVTKHAELLRKTSEIRVQLQMAPIDLSGIKHKLDSLSHANLETALKPTPATFSTFQELARQTETIENLQETHDAMLKTVGELNKTHATSVILKSLSARHPTARSTTSSQLTFPQPTSPITPEIIDHILPRVMSAHAHIAKVQTISLLLQDLVGSPSVSTVSAVSSPSAKPCNPNSPVAMLPQGCLRDLGICKVCWERPRNTRLAPCGHGCLCSTCAEAVSLCPVCRAKIEARQTIFM